MMINKRLIGTVSESKKYVAGNFYQHLRYDYGGRLFVPVDFWMTKLFKGDRGQNKEPGRKARMDSLIKTLEFVSRW